MAEVPDKKSLLEKIKIKKGKKFNSGNVKTSLIHFTSTNSARGLDQTLAVLVGRHCINSAVGHNTYTHTHTHTHNITYHFNGR